jgi:hypothetical protein
MHEGRAFVSEAVACGMPDPARLAARRPSDLPPGSGHPGAPRVTKSAREWAKIKADPELLAARRAYQHRYRTTRYWTDDEYRERCLEEMRHRYATDPAFRKRAIERAAAAKRRRRRRRQ